MAIDEDVLDFLREKVGEYKDDFAAYRRYKGFLEDVLKRACKRMFPYALVEARVKEEASFAEKVVRKLAKYQRDPNYDITDRCGARVVTQTVAEKALVCEYIRKHFLIDEANSLDKRTELKDDQFGYLGVHYVVQLKDEVRDEGMEGVALSGDVRVGQDGLKAEIQVKTMLEHAWASPLHDRMYKVAIKVRPPMRREAAGLMALIEDADVRIDHLAGQVDSFLGHYAAFLTPEELEQEIEVTEALLAFEQCRAKCPHIVDLPEEGALAPCGEDEMVKARVAGLYLRLGKLKSLKGDRAGAIAAWERGLACQAESQEALKLELGYALALAQREDTRSAAYKRGQKMLREIVEAEPDPDEVETPSRRVLRAEASHRLAWTYGNVSGREAEARDQYRKALDLAPGDPYHLAAHLGYEVSYLPNREFVQSMRDYVMQAIDTCRAHIDVGIEQPRAQFTMGRLHLLLGNHDEAIDAYLRAIRLLMVPESYTPVEVLVDEIGFLDIVNRGRSMPPEHDQIRRLLLLARAAKRLQKGMAYDLQEAMSEEAKCGELGSPDRALVVVGGAGLMQLREGKEEEYRKIIAWALDHAEGIVCSGGTDVGIPGIVGAEAEKRKNLCIKRFMLVSYLPMKFDDDIPRDGRYDVRVHTQGDDFGPLEPIQGWVDLLGLGLSPDSIRILGIEGGKVAAVEYRLALALGAKVAIIPGSGRQADILLQDPEWSQSPNLIRLPEEVVDSATMRAFVRPSTLMISREKLEELAEMVHEKYLASTPYSDVDPVRRKYRDLREDLKDSNREQILYAAEILASQGFDVEYVGEGQDIELPEFTPDQIEQMAPLEHGRWNIERLAAGWQPGPEKDVNAKINNSLKPWDQLSDGPDGVKKYDRTAIGDYAKLLKEAGYRIVPKSGS